MPSDFIWLDFGAGEWPDTVSVDYRDDCWSPVPAQEKDMGERARHSRGQVAEASKAAGVCVAVEAFGKVWNWTPTGITTRRRRARG